MLKLTGTHIRLLGDGTYTEEPIEIDPRDISDEPPGLALVAMELERLRTALDERAGSSSGAFGPRVEGRRARTEPGGAAVAGHGAGDEDDLITARDVMALLKYPSLDAVYQARRRGQLPCYRRGGRLLFSRRELVALVKATPR